MLNRTPMFVHGNMSAIIPDCATGGDATSGGTISGSIVDRLQMAREFEYGQPVVMGTGLSNTSTGGIKHAKLDVYLRHGDSSGGGDQAEISTGLRVAQQPVFNTGLTTDEKAWTTGSVRVQHSGAAYDLRGVKRWLSAAAIVTRAGVTTATAAGNLLTVGLGLNLIGADDEPPSRKALIPGGDEVLFTTATNT